MLATGFGTAYAHSEAGKRKRIVQQVFGDRISAKTFRALVESDQPLQLNGEVCEASVVVCEIFNHDILAEALSPADYVALTNEFLRTGAEVLVEAGGYLDECDGESLRAVFGAPLQDSTHAATASLAACLLGHRLEDLCRQFIERWKVAPDYRIGVNSGEMIAAAYGSNHLGTFSVAGEPLEFCRRLCVANTFYGSRILLGPRAFQLSNGAVEVRPMELIRSRKGPGREEIYELLAPKDTLSEEEKERRDLFWKGVVLFREKRLDEAAAHFQSSLHIGNHHTEDAPARFYLERIEHARAGVQALDWDNAKL
jgi:class 3 adenylate cyclase